MFSTRILADSSLPCWCHGPSEASCDGDLDGAYFEKLGHCAPLLLCDCRVLLLDHAQSADGELQLHLDFTLRHVSAMDRVVVERWRGIGTYDQGG